MLLCYKVVFGVLCVGNKVYQLFLEETLQTDCVKWFFSYNRLVSSNNFDYLQSP